MDNCPPACRLFVRSFFVISEDLIKAEDQPALVGLTYALTRLSNVEALIDVCFISDSAFFFIPRHYLQLFSFFCPVDSIFAFQGFGITFIISVYYLFFKDSE